MHKELIEYPTGKAAREALLRFRAHEDVASIELLSGNVLRVSFTLEPSDDHVDEIVPETDVIAPVSDDEPVEAQVVDNEPVEPVKPKPAKKAPAKKKPAAKKAPAKKENA